MPGQKPRHFKFNYFVTMISRPKHRQTGTVRRCLVKFYFAASPVAPAGTPVTVCTLLKAPLAATA